MKRLTPFLFGTLIAAFSLAGCAPIHTFPVPIELDKIEPYRTPPPIRAGQSFRRERQRDQKRRAQKCTIGRNKKQRIGERKRRGR